MDERVHAILRKYQMWWSKVKWSPDAVLENCGETVVSVKVWSFDSGIKDVGLRVEQRWKNCEEGLGDPCCEDTDVGVVVVRCPVCIGCHP